MSIGLQESRSIVRMAVRNPVHKNRAIWLPPLSRRYVWVRDKLVPALRKLEIGNAADQRLASLGYFELGDTFSFFFGAPKAAVRAYRSSVRLNPKFGLAWHEIGFELELLGDAFGCQRAHRNAVKYAPDEQFRDMWKCDIQEVTPAYVQEIKRVVDDSEPAYEYLASFKPHLALRFLAGMEEVHHLKACAYSALGDIDGFLREWAKSKGDLNGSSIGLIQSYFFTRPIFSSPEFWKIMIELGSTHDWMFCPFQDSLEIIYPRSKNIRASWLRQKYRRQKLAAQLKFAETSKSVREAEKICKRFPKWKEAIEILRKLKKAKDR